MMAPPVLMTDPNDVKHTCHPCWNRLADGSEKMGGYRCVGQDWSVLVKCANCGKNVGPSAMRWQKVINAH